MSGLAAWLLIALVRAYQVTLSPLLSGQCRFVPTCSQYFIEAVRTRGPAAGLALGLWRIVRCNPFSKGGYDPVPGNPIVAVPPRRLPAGGVRRG